MAIASITRVTHNGYLTNRPGGEWAELSIHETGTGYLWLKNDVSEMTGVPLNDDDLDRLYKALRKRHLGRLRKQREAAS